MAKKHLRLVAPATVLRTVPPKRPPNPDLRTREHLTEAEVERLIKSVNRNRHGHRDATMVLVAYRHGLRAAELVDLRWEQVDFRTASLHVRRAKQGTPSSIRSSATSCARSGGSSAIRNRSRSSCSHQSAAPHSPPLASRA